MSTITLLNITDLRTTLLTGTLRNAQPTAPTTFNDWPLKAGLPTWNRLPLTSVNHYRHHTNDSFTTLPLQMNEQNDLTSLTDRDRPITTDLRHLSLTANNITAKLTNQCIQDDDFRSGCRNVRCHYRQQSFSGLHSPGRSNYTITERKSKQHTSCSSLYQVRRFPTSEKEIGKGAKKWLT